MIQVRRTCDYQRHEEPTRNAGGSQSYSGSRYVRTTTSLVVMQQNASILSRWTTLADGYAGQTDAHNRFITLLIKANIKYAIHYLGCMRVRYVHCWLSSPVTTSSTVNASIQHPIDVIDARARWHILRSKPFTSYRSNPGWGLERKASTNYRHFLLHRSCWWAYLVLMHRNNGPAICDITGKHIMLFIATM